MLAFFASSIGRDLIIGLLILSMIGGLYFYYKNTQNTIMNLSAELALVKVQSKDLQVAKDDFEKKVSQMTAAQQTANIDIAKVREDAALANRQIRATHEVLKNSTNFDPAAVEKQINEDQASALKALEEVSK